MSDLFNHIYKTNSYWSTESLRANKKAYDSRFKTKQIAIIFHSYFITEFIYIHIPYTFPHKFTYYNF